jgi:hypothetical protein
MPGPRNRPPKPKKKRKTPYIEAAPSSNAPSPEAPPDSSEPSAKLFDRYRYHPAGPFAEDPAESKRGHVSYLDPTGEGVTLSGVSAFLETSFAAPPSLGDPHCAVFARHDVLDIFRLYLPEELALVYLPASHDS